MIQYYEYDLRSTRLPLSSVQLFQPVAITRVSKHKTPTISFILLLFLSLFSFCVSLSVRLLYFICYISLSTFQQRQRIKSYSVSVRRWEKREREGEKCTLTYKTSDSLCCVPQFIREFSTFCVVLVQSKTNKTAKMLTSTTFLSVW